MVFHTVEDGGNAAKTPHTDSNQSRARQKFVRNAYRRLFGNFGLISFVAATLLLDVQFNIPGTPSAKRFSASPTECPNVSLD
jgi:hypothetical protein